MQVSERIHKLIAEVLHDAGRPVPAMQADTGLFAAGLGLESLDFATLVVRLEQETGYDPFRSGDQEQLPQTVGQLVALYERQRPAGGQVTK